MATFLLRILTFITFLSNVVSALEPSGEDLREGEDQNAWGRGRHLRTAKENEDLMTVSDSPNKIVLIAIVYIPGQY
jgi:hypothetical protein